MFLTRFLAVVKLLIFDRSDQAIEVLVKIDSSVVTVILGIYFIGDL